MPRLPGWVPRNPGCGCLILFLGVVIYVLIRFDGN
jgi:hypothetical protein